VMGYVDVMKKTGAVCRGSGAFSFEHFWCRLRHLKKQSILWLISMSWAVHGRRQVCCVLRLLSTSSGTHRIRCCLNLFHGEYRLILSLNYLEKRDIHLPSVVVIVNFNIWLNVHSNIIDEYAIHCGAVRSFSLYRVKWDFISELPVYKLVG